MTCAGGHFSSTAEIPRPLRFDVEAGLEMSFGLVDLICFWRGMSISESESESTIFSADFTLTDSFFFGVAVLVVDVGAIGFSAIGFAAGLLVVAFAAAFFFVIIPPPTFLTGLTISSSAALFAGILGILGLIAGESTCRGVLANGRSRSSLASLPVLFFGISVTTFSSMGGNLASTSFCCFSTISLSLVV